MMQLADLIGWCKAPHPQDHPRLQRAVGANLERFDADGGEDIESFRWTGVLRLSTLHTRFVAAQLIGSLSLVGDSAQLALVAVADAPGADAWAGLQGPHIPPAYAEDIHLDASETNWDSNARFFSTVLQVVGGRSHFDLQMWPTYAYGG